MATKKTKRKTKVQRKTLDEHYMGPEPGVDYFETGKSLHDFFG